MTLRNLPFNQLCKAHEVLHKIPWQQPPLGPAHMPAALPAAPCAEDSGSEGLYLSTTASELRIEKTECMVTTAAVQTS